MDIEGCAAAKVLESLALTDRLVAHISLRDREPIWDGSVYVYNDADKHRNENLKGRVPIQIKGELATNKKNFCSNIKYPIKVVDLHHYLEDGGAVFFVVKITKDPNSFQIYAIKLLPYTIKKLLSDAKDQKHISVKLSAFPKKESQKINCFFNMLDDMRKQKSVIQLDHLKTLEELQQKFTVSRVVMSFTDTAVDEKNPYMYLMENSVFQYAELPDGITIPVRELPPAEKLSAQSKAKITCGGQIFFDSFSQEFTREKRTMLFGRCVSIAYNLTGAPSATLNFSAIGTLKEIINAASFLCSLIKEKVFYIADVPLKFEIPNNSGNGNINDFEKYTTALKTLESALHKVGFYKDLILSELSEQDVEALNSLVSSVVAHRAVPLRNAPDRHHSFVMKIGDYNIMLLAKRVSKNMFQLGNFFSRGTVVEFDDSVAEEYVKKAPGVIVLGIDGFLTLDNIDYDVIYSEITTFPDVDKKYYNAVNLLLLFMLSAFDKKPNQELLTCATRIAEWLCSLVECRDDDISVLNYLQAVRRQRDLNDAERTKLMNIINSNPQNNALMTGAYIVLQDFSGAEKAFAQLSKADQDDFSQWPIMNLWKKIEQQPEDKA
ncbi:MAG: hypothetical protein IJS01_10395 [Lentisphaeria bacterium]|nr:hypothetical protein [Lentisphaeria bacterium]